MKDGANSRARVTANETQAVYRHLASKIIAQAIKDYKYGVNKSSAATKQECERFFRSDWFAILAEITGSDKFASTNERSILIDRLKHSSAVSTSLRKFGKAIKREGNI